MKLTPQQKQLAIAGTVIAAIAVVAIVTASTREQPVQPAQEGQQATTTPTTTPASANTAPKAPSKATIDKAAAYAKALEDYAGRYIQFNEKCQPYPANTTFKSGTAIMFDNRGTQPITLALDTNKFTIKAKDYLTMKVTSKVLPKNISIDCNSSFNVGQILLQQ